MLPFRTSGRVLWKSLGSITNQSVPLNRALFMAKSPAMEPLGLGAINRARICWFKRCLASPGSTEMRTSLPVPFGLAVVDLFTGAHLVQGILAGLVRRGITGKGAKVEVSLLESILDFQFEVITTYLNDGSQLPRRSAINNAHAYLGAPYGIYATADGFLALAMGSVPRLGELLRYPQLLAFTDPQSLFDRRDEIKQLIADHLKTQNTAYWLSLLEPADIWCSDVYTWPGLFEHEGFQALDMVQEVVRLTSGSSRIVC
jgi:crotonobetainyl-CoA:carnitine CoA-transferase CaiB-like acyl-CoA transferase